MNEASIQYIVWREFGLAIEKEKESIDGLEVYISVPEDSYKVNAHGEKMCGMFLAKRFKQVLVEMGIKRLTVRARVRTGDEWTPEKAEQANIKARQEMFGIQW